MSDCDEPVRRRLPPHEREANIVKQAIGFFAREGFGGNTRELAKNLGVTQPLLYRYFRTKDALIERVYEEVFASVWNSNWTDWLEDRSVAIEDRLQQFYRSYARSITTYEWTRLFMFAALRGLDFNRRFLSDLRTRVFSRVVRELRLMVEGPTLEELAMTEAEAEAVWSLHAAIYYLGVRKHIHNLPTPVDFELDIDLKVRVFLGGVFKVIATGK